MKCRHGNRINYGTAYTVAPIALVCLSDLQSGFLYWMSGLQVRLGATKVNAFCVSCARKQTLGGF